jgi:eukaryotic-like serine/threonine-protein kinase
MATALLIADRYELLDPVGRGGMAVVHRGWDRRLDRPVAIKAFHTESGSDAESARRRSETQLLASLHHPSLVTLFDAVATDDATYLVMELVEGPTLRQWLQRSVLPLDTAAAMAASLAEGLHFIHERGIVHRDVKPANVLLAPSPIPGRPPLAKLSDFGIARLVESDRVTSTGTFVGTAQYLSPEQARGQTVGPPSDVYSLGLTLLEAITGATSFPGNPIESATARLARDPVIPGSLGYGWKSLLTAMTSRNPAARPTALDVVLRAQALLAGDVEEAPTEPAGPATTHVPTSTTPMAAPTTPTAAPPTPVPATRPVRAAPATAPAPAPAPESGAAHADEPDSATRVLPLDRQQGEPFDDLLGDPAEAEATSVLPATALRGPGVVARLQQHPAVARLRQHPALALGLAGLAAVLLAVVLIVALMPGTPSPQAAPALPSTGEPLHTHLQHLLESVSP